MRPLRGWLWRIIRKRQNIAAHFTPFAFFPFCLTASTSAFGALRIARVTAWNFRIAASGSETRTSLAVLVGRDGLAGVVRMAEDYNKILFCAAA
jgi:hypothetical protein